jgi:hypothetical protein
LGCSAAYYDPRAATARFTHRASVELRCVEVIRGRSTGKESTVNTTEFYKPPPLTEADMKFLRHLGALDRTHPLVRAHHEDLFQQLLAQQGQASMALFVGSIETHRSGSNPTGVWSPACSGWIFWMP